MRILGRHSLVGRPTWLTELGFRNRTANCFARERILTVDHLVRHSRKEFMGLPYFGKQCLEDVVTVLSDHGFSLLGEYEEVKTDSE